MFVRRMLVMGFAAVVVLWPYAVPMGEADQQGSLKEPVYTPLNDGEESYDACIKDEQTITDVTQFSFFGHTSIGGIRKETDDSVTKLDLANIKTIKVLARAHTSKRYPEKDFCLIQKVSNEGAVSDELLMPRHVVICGIEKRTGDEKAWYLNKIDQITITKSEIPLPEAPNMVVPAQKTESVKRAVERASQPVEQQPSRVAEEKVAQDKSVTTEFPPQPKQMSEAQQEPIKPLVIKEQHKEKEIVVVEKKASEGDISSVWGAFANVFIAIADLFKAIFNFIKGLFIQ